MIPLIRIHTLSHGRATLTVAHALEGALGMVGLVSPAGAAGSLGIGWWSALVRRIGGEFPDWPRRAILDCAESPGLALAALRAGLPALWVTTANPVATARLTAIATSLGATATTPPDWPILDLLGSSDPERAAAAYLTVALRPLPPPDAGECKEGGALR